MSPEGCVYSPPASGSTVLVFDAHGLPLPSLSVASLGLSSETSWSAYVASDMPSLLLADDKLSSVLVAVDPATFTVHWRIAAESLCLCGGIAALPALGVVIVGCVGGDRALFAHRLSDGIRVGSLQVPELWLFLASDPGTGAVYGSMWTEAPDMWSVHAWSCAADGATIRISSLGRVTAAGAAESTRIVAVVPPAPGKMISHLVVGTPGSPELLVLSLPGLALVHTHILSGLDVLGLAADPWGGALAVCDEVSRAIHVLAWPLPGMLPLQ